MIKNISIDKTRGRGNNLEGNILCLGGTFEFDTCRNLDARLDNGYSWMGFAVQLTCEDDEEGLPDPPEDVGQVLRDGARVRALLHRRQRVLDGPAGHGQLAEALAQLCQRRPHLETKRIQRMLGSQAGIWENATVQRQ